MVRGGSGEGRAEESAVADRLAVALEAARAAGDIAMQYFRKPSMVVERKPDGSEVTNADKAGERAIREMVAARFPGDAILGEEEGGEGDGGAGYRWIIDPIDGTRSYVLGIPTFANLVAVARGEEIVAGVAHLPALGETLWARRGGGAWWRVDGREVEASTSRQEDLSRGCVEVMWPQSFLKGGHWGVYEAVVRSCRRAKGWSDAFSFALCATGRAEGIVAFGFSIWDVAPFGVIIPEAGGAITDWAGGAIVRTPRYAVASSRGLHPRLLEVVRGGA